MISRSTVAALITAAVAVAAPMSLNDPATAADELCQGQPATIVTTDDQRNAVGTPGPDVVLIEVPDARITVDTGAGDDLVCVRGEKYDVTLALGDGDDSVLIEGGTPFKQTAQVEADLGRGSDTYVGAGGDDVVTTGESLSTAPDGPDAVSTGDGSDRLLVTGVVGSVDLGEGGDLIVLSNPTFTAPIRGGTGRDGIIVDDVTSVRVDLRKDLLRVDDAPAVSLVGIAGSVQLAARDATAIGNGANSIFQVTACRAVVKGGRGSDQIRAGSGFTELGCTGEVSQRWFGNQGSDGIQLSGRDDEVFGGPGDDIINGVNGADRISGGGGDDILVGAAGPDVIFGGNGNDSLFGGPGADGLYGGVGRDRARGSSGLDRCDVEIRSGCER